MNKRLISIPTDGSFQINPASIGAGLTQSEMGCWDDCPEKWYLGYNLMLYKLGKFAWPLAYGGWMHGALEEFYASKGKRWTINCEIKDRKFVSQEKLADEDYWAGVADIQMQMYASHYKHDHKLWTPDTVEEIVDIEFRGVRLTGMIDMYALSLMEKKKPSYYVWDHKTAYRIDKTTVIGWDFRFQFMFYCWIASKVKKWANKPCRGFVINAIRKPQLVWNPEKESLKQHLQRLQIHMQENPEKYYYRDKLLLKPKDLKHFEDHILGPKIDRLKLILDPKTPEATKLVLARNKNTNHCVSKFGTVCEFLPACQKGLAIEGHQYRQRDTKHLELVTEEIE